MSETTTDKTEDLISAEISIGGTVYTLTTDAFMEFYGEGCDSGKAFSGGILVDYADRRIVLVGNFNELDLGTVIVNLMRRASKGAI